MQLVKIFSSSINKLNQRIVKVLGYGKNDVKTGIASAPYGVDSNPIEGMVGVYSETQERGKMVLIGYINKSHLAAPGELRHFSTDANGVVKSFVWLKGDGSIQLNGAIDNAVRYAALNTALQEEVVKINAELVKIAASLTSIPAPVPYVPTPVSVDISASKINDVKTT